MTYRTNLFHRFTESCSKVQDVLDLHELWFSQKFPIIPTVEKFLQFILSIHIHPDSHLVLPIIFYILVLHLAGTSKGVSSLCLAVSLLWAALSPQEESRYLAGCVSPIYTHCMQISGSWPSIYLPESLTILSDLPRYLRVACDGQQVQSSSTKLKICLFLVGYTLSCQR